MLDKALVQKVEVNLVDGEVERFFADELDILADYGNKAEYMIVPI